MDITPARSAPLAASGLPAFTLATLLLGAHAGAETVSVRHPQGWAHGFVEVTTTDGKRIGIGDLLQRLRGNVVTSRLVLNLFDGSLDDETTVYAQERQFRLISDHHVQHGASFPKPADVTIDAVKHEVRWTDEDGKSQAGALDMPPDVYNGMASTMIMNLPRAAASADIAIVIVAGKPRIAHLHLKHEGTRSFTLGGKSRTADEFSVHVELGGIAGVVAPVVGKEPPDYHVLIGGAEDPVFLREDGPLYVGGPIWRVQQISAEMPSP
jgi:hypothetical protein